MPITFHPHAGKVLLCDFGNTAIPPEMVKARPVVVISRRGQGLCTVVPLSTTPPNPVLSHHHLMMQDSLPLHLRGPATWAKCDIVTSVSFARLDRFKVGKDANGKRIYVDHKVTPEDLKAIQACVLHHLGLNRLLPHL